jgi:hypothetical protein
MKPNTRKLENHPLWRGVNASQNNKRKRARTRWELTLCEKCGSPATDRHHKTGNLDDCSKNEIQILCRKCHMEIDGRLNLLIKKAKNRPSPRIKKPCVNCGDNFFPLRKGLCHKCNEYLRRHKCARPEDPGRVSVLTKADCDRIILAPQGIIQDIAKELRINRDCAYKIRRNGMPKRLKPSV